MALMLLASLLGAGCDRQPTEQPESTAAPSYEALVHAGFTDPSMPRITAADLKIRLDRGDQIILIDTRTASKFRDGHLAGAVNIANAVNSPVADDEAEMERALATLPDGIMKVLYCD